MAKKRLGELLIEAGLVDALQLAVALGEQNQWGGPLGAALIKKGFINAADLAHVLSRQLGIDWISLRDREIPQEVVNSLGMNLAKRHKAMPIALDDRAITVAMVNPMDLKAVDAIAFATGKRIKPVLAIESEIMMTIARYYDKNWVDEGRFSQSYLTRKVTDRANVSVDGREIYPPPSFRSPAVMAYHKLDALVRILVKKGYFTEQELLKEMMVQNDEVKPDDSLDGIKTE